MALSPLFRPASYGEIAGWAGDDHRLAFEAFRRSALHTTTVKPYRTGSLGVEAASFLAAFDAALAVKDVTADEARDFFVHHFTPVRVLPDTGASQGFVTGFYEPEAEASPVRTETFRFPLYRRPSDLVDVDDANRPPGMDPYLAFARQTAGGLAEYPDRAAIESGLLNGRGLEIAWLADKVDLFFIHVQGAARLALTDGTSLRVTYAAKSGQHFTGPGGVLADLGEIPRPVVTMQSIRAWFARNPDRIDEILHRNRSFIFFRETAVDDPGLGPIAAAKVPLTPGRSIAVDRLLHTFGTPFMIHAPSLTAFDGTPFRRLMIAQDTGSAILGSARADLFAGSGPAAGEIAGVIKHPADFIALLPKPLLGQVHR